MRTHTIAARVLADCKALVHQRHWQRVVDLCSYAPNSQALTPTQLALGSGSKTTLRHRVKAVDRVLGSATFATDDLDEYRTLTAGRSRGVSALDCGGLAEPITLPPPAIQIMTAR